MKFIFFLLLSIIVGCSLKSIANNVNEEEGLVFGTGGGFTGAVSYYKLLKNGNLYRSGNTDNSLILIGTLSTSVTNQMFDSYKVLNIDGVNLNDPGNRYYFIEKINKNNAHHKVTWGHAPLEHKSLAIFHDVLMNNVKTLNKKNNS
ncbi:MAG TPA: hypothetical protein PKD85_04280 [Saprospiraceae bacterium]|nr:hypothetical protein [Saprospiraceae bacterium]